MQLYRHCPSRRPLIPVSRKASLLDTAARRHFCHTSTPKVLLVSTVCGLQSAFCGLQPSSCLWTGLKCINSRCWTLFLPRLSPSSAHPYDVFGVSKDMRGENSSRAASKSNQLKSESCWLVCPELPSSCESQDQKYHIVRLFFLVLPRGAYTLQITCS